MKRLLFLLLISTIPFVYGATLRIGTVPEYPPFSSMADKKDHFYGFDIDIMSAICARMSVQCQFIPVIYNQLFPQLIEQNIDVAIAAIVITKERQQAFLVSYPYLESSGQFITKKTSPINTLDDIKNKTIGVRKGTIFGALASKLYSKQANIVTLPEVSNLLSALNNNSVDILFINTEAANYWFANNNDLYKLIGKKILAGSGYGIVANKGQQDLMQKINQALLDMEEDGTYLSIYGRYFD